MKENIYKRVACFICLKSEHSAKSCKSIVGGNISAINIIHQSFASNATKSKLSSVIRGFACIIQMCNNISFFLAFTDQRGTIQAGIKEQTESFRFEFTKKIFTGGGRKELRYLQLVLVTTDLAYNLKWISHVENNCSLITVDSDCAGPSTGFHDLLHQSSNGAKMVGK